MTGKSEGVRIRLSSLVVYATEPLSGSKDVPDG